MEGDPKDLVNSRICYQDVWEAKGAGLPVSYATVVDYRTVTDDYWIKWDSGYEAAYPRSYVSWFKIVGKNEY